MQQSLLQIDITKILFLDIETVPQYQTFDVVPEVDKKLWGIKSKRLQSPDIEEAELYKKAGIFAEFGKIICISVAYIVKKKQIQELRVRSFSGVDEKQILIDFLDLIRKHFNKSQTLLCAHNGLEFDFPYIARRALIHSIQIPECLDTRGKKPWEVQHIDTLDLWRFGDYKHYTSLHLLTHIFNIPTPKDDIDGSMVCDIYWKEEDLERIVAYCQKDVVAVVQLLLKYRCQDLIPEDLITIVS